MTPSDNNEELVSLLTSKQSDLLSYILSILPDREQAEEVLQATNLVIWRKANEYQPGSNFIAWAFQIARFQVMSHRERSDRSTVGYSQELMDELSQLAADRVMSRSSAEMQDALLHCLEEIPERRRELIWMRYRDNFKIAEAAGHIGKSVDATQQLLRRLRLALMRCIEHTLAEGGAA